MGVRWMVAMTPYFEDESVTIYHGEALAILPELSGCGAVVTEIEERYCEIAAKRMAQGVLL